MLRKTETLQKVEAFHTGLARSTGDALGNVPVSSPSRGSRRRCWHMREVSDALIRKQVPVLFWWSVVAVATALPQR